MNPSTLKPTELPAELPDDAASLKAMLLSLMAAHEQEKQRADQQSSLAAFLQKKSDELYIDNLRLQVQVDRFKRWYYGPRADKLSTALEQYPIDIEDHVCVDVGASTGGTRHAPTPHSGKISPSERTMNCTIAVSPSATGISHAATTRRSSHVRCSSSSV